MAEVGLCKRAGENHPARFCMRSRKTATFPRLPLG